MDTEPTSDHPEEEYHFIEHEGPEDFGAAAAPEPPQKSPKGFKNKKILLVIGLIAVIFSLYKLLDILFTSRTSTRTPTKVTTTVESLPMMSTAKPKPILTEVPPEPVAESLTSQNAGPAATQATVDNLSKQVADLQNSLTALDNRLSDLTNTVNNLNTKAAVAVVEPVSAPVLEHARKKPVRIRGRCGCGGEIIKIVKPMPIFYVTAMVQGRAWLLAGNGGTVTVAIGDQLPGYGIVRTIDTHQGTILMSSGAIIGYSPDDS